MILVVVLGPLEMLREKMGRIVVAAGWLSDLSTEMLWLVAVIVIVKMKEFVQSRAAGVMSYWKAVDLVVQSYWKAVGLVVQSYWKAVGLVVQSYWKAVAAHLQLSFFLLTI
jgi:hypothetical protein